MRQIIFAEKYLEEWKGKKYPSIDKILAEFGSRDEGGINWGHASFGDYDSARKAYALMRHCVDRVSGPREDDFSIRWHY